jgi:hypothetical protein
MFKINQYRERSAHWLKSLGNGIITGASEGDPSGIATYSQAGAGACNFPIPDPSSLAFNSNLYSENDVPS